jgi:hypothetical protein
MRPFITMKTALSAIVILAASSVLAGAAGLTNKDADDVTIVLTVEGIRGEVAIASNATVAECENGCFLTLPNGDRAALAGSETVSIVNGGLVIE